MLFPIIISTFFKEIFMKDKLKTALTLFGVFFKIGAFTFGGGYAMIPIIEKEVSEKRAWISEEDILDIFAISESTPGPIAINTATFIGYKIGGVLGSAFATLGVVLPSFIIISIISLILTEFSHLKPVQYAFNGIRAGVLALLIKALVSMYKKNKKSLFAYIIMAGAFVLAAFTNINVIFVLIGCGVAGLTYSLITLRRAKK
jgi:chromate transporter